ncbi:MAG: hypothetical protein KJ606_01980 [Chloroflexi bacterium]|nr:hypothetical protein [Chloroflexota bacterium]
MVTVDPLTRSDPVRIQRMVREVIAAHPEDYVSPDGWQENAVRAMQGLLESPAHQQLLSELLSPAWGFNAAPNAPLQGTAPNTQPPPADSRRLGF